MGSVPSEARIAALSDTLGGVFRNEATVGAVSVHVPVEILSRSIVFVQRTDYLRRQVASTRSLLTCARANFADLAAGRCATGAVTLAVHIGIVSRLRVARSGVGTFVGKAKA